jgi:hypothetical protein
MPRCTYLRYHKGSSGSWDWPPSPSTDIVSLPLGLALLDVIKACGGPESRIGEDPCPNPGSSIDQRIPRTVVEANRSLLSFILWQFFTKE